jgi:hypothetical protein
MTLFSSNFKLQRSLRDFQVSKALKVKHGCSFLIFWPDILNFDNYETTEDEAPEEKEPAKETHQNPTQNGSNHSDTSDTSPSATPIHTSGEHKV